MTTTIIDYDHNDKNNVFSELQPGDIFEFCDMLASNYIDVFGTYLMCTNKECFVDIESGELIKIAQGMQTLQVTVYNMHVTLTEI